MTTPADDPLAVTKARLLSLESDLHALRGSHEACFHMLQRKCDMLEQMIVSGGPGPDLLFKHERGLIEEMDGDNIEYPGLTGSLLKIIKRLAPRPEEGG